MLYVVLIVIGIALGIIFTTLMKRKKSVGFLRIDRSDPDGPYLFLELKRDPRDLYGMNLVTLEVKLENFSSQK